MTQTPSTTAPDPRTHRASDPSKAADVVIKCAGLTKIFKDFWLRNRVKAVDNVNLDVKRGQVFGLLGPNGSGKSTTIKMILGLLHPTAGRIAVFGKAPEDVKTKGQIGYLPEESYLYPFLNARETLDYYARLFHLSRDQRRRRIDMLLDMVGLEQVARRPIGEYSKGMQRRIGLAQALINDPALLILDEPTSGLDPIGTRQIKDLIIELSRRGKTILLCSHLLADVEDVCDEVAIMFGGKVRTQGTVGELLVQEGFTTIQTPELDVTEIEEIEALLTKYGKHIEKVDQPRQKLEALFLDIVHKAQAEGASTSGARAGGQIAGFLVEEEARGAHLPENVRAAKVIDELVKPQPTAQPQASRPTTPPEAPDKSQAKAEPPKPTPSVHHEVISQLTQKPEPPKPAAPSAPKAPAADLSVINKLVTPAAASPPPAPASPPSPPTPAPAAQVQTPPPPTTPAPPAPPAPTSSAPPEAPSKPEPPASPPTPPEPPKRPERVSSTGEKPDEGFINALLNVKPYVPENDAERGGDKGQKPKDA